MSGIAKKVLIVWLALAVLGFVAVSGPALVGQEQEKKLKGRLPAYYADLVTEQQKNAIYAIQARYHAKIAVIQEELKTLEKKQDAEIENVLTPPQRIMLKKARDEAAIKRKKTAAEKKLVEAAMNAAAAPAAVKKGVRK